MMLMRVGWRKFKRRGKYRDSVLSHEVWPSFNEALLALVAMKTKSESAVPYIVKMLELDDGGEDNV